MLKMFWNKKRRSEGGFTLIELVVVLAILGILIALAVPRYLGARRSALIAEGDNTLQELKTLSWAYYQQYGDWTGVTSGNMATTFGFSAPGTSCFVFSTPGGGAASIAMTATTPAPGQRAVCAALPPATVITLTLSADGSSGRTQVIP